MVAKIRRRRNKPARELAEEFGVSIWTIYRMIGEPREEYVARAKARRDAIVALRVQGLLRREIAERMGVTPAIVGRSLQQARQKGEWDAAVAAAEEAKKSGS
ncbi:hypothetical protein Ae168Ps1_6403c [Pseudonocardia sp. Ae168_Ps1]|uniref:hypothetical protein n=1 Tax=unclassified Pseudonocardia TaxID=2619320 RepID=UPI00094B6D81|nr:MULTISPECIES: hypothetical protein [unclassified Pseudonocardia]OLL69845.1 hypothetical protein Ae150APs1_6256c [Pseudonocardia sp. Ae150A_Ps1]OLL69978.1 hypothetical protein Ae168Ps1_6403c [Pseudonocardia sp. Ae168_Ps1]